MPVTRPAASEHRPAYALATLGWAYLEAILVSQGVAATGFLTSFQRTYNDHRADLVRTFDNPGAAEGILPRSLAIDGVFGPNTAHALGGAFIAVGHASGESIPTRVASLPAWFRGFKRSVPASNFVPARANALLAETARDPQNAGANSSAWAWGYVEGLNDAGSGSLIDDILSANTPPPITTAAPIAQQAAVLTAPGGQLLPVEFIRGRAPAWQRYWPWLVAGGGLLTLGGLLGWSYWRRRTGR